jgi:hypothetical protein
MTDKTNNKEMLDLAHNIWADTKTANKVGLEANRLANIAYIRKTSFFSGKSSKCIAGGLFYILGYRFDAKKSQRQLADKLETSDNSIRASYKRWMATFPDLFVDTSILFSLTKENPKSRFAVFEPGL